MRLRRLRRQRLQKMRDVYPDRVSDSERHRGTLRYRGVAAEIARCRSEHGSCLSKYRRIVECTDVAARIPPYSCTSKRRADTLKGPQSPVA
jgi:hypothetical protein